MWRKWLPIFPRLRLRSWRENWICREEYPEKNPRHQIEIGKSQPTCRAQDSIPGLEVGGATYDHYTPTWFPKKYECLEKKILISISAEHEKCLLTTSCNGFRHCNSFSVSLFEIEEKATHKRLPRNKENC